MRGSQRDVSERSQLIIQSASQCGVRVKQNVNLHHDIILESKRCSKIDHLILQVSRSVTVIKSSNNEPISTLGDKLHAVDLLPVL
jgi:hypothetical protein